MIQLSVAGLRFPTNAITTTGRSSRSHLCVRTSRPRHRNGDQAQVDKEAVVAANEQANARGGAVRTAIRPGGSPEPQDSAGSKLPTSCHRFRVDLVTETADSAICDQLSLGDAPTLGSNLTGLAGPSRSMELAGLESATSWVRSRRRTCETP